MASPSKGVKFGAKIVVTADGNVESDDVDIDEEYCEIFTSEGEAESFATSDEEDAELLQMALEGAYTCSPFKHSAIIDPAERSSYLLLDKDLMSEDECDNEQGN